ncbi:MAG TPA: nucleotidyl transferase AbiEii/AbiGii toxin family protein [Candidatus Paceibacterota bacterium]
MFPEILSETAKQSLDTLKEIFVFRSAYLAGGTALALQLGHRYSYDLDFFTQQKFAEKALTQELGETLSDFHLERQEWRTILGFVKDMRFSIFYYKYPLLFPTHEFGGVQVADVKDIAPMKIDAIADRGTKRDFIDLYFLLFVNKIVGLEEAFDLYEKKFGNLAQNKVHILKSLVYFDDAEEDAMPQMIKDVSWDAVKQFFLEQQKTLSQKLLF